jgi:hypothetical protein
MTGKDDDDDDDDENMRKGATVANLKVFARMNGGKLWIKNSEQPGITA